MRNPFSQNQSQFKRLLTIDNPAEETIFGVIGRMEVLLDYFNSHPRHHNLIPFLHTYYLVTKRGADRYMSHKHAFWNMRDYEILDIYFAGLYFKPLLAYLENNQPGKPWQHYFDYCKNKNGLPFLQIMLGINAHINSDLYKALIDLDYNNKKDFFLVNGLLAEIEPEIVKLLAKEHDLVGLSGLAFRNFISDEFKNIIVRWRREAWENFQSTNSSHKLSNHLTIVQNTENIGKQLIQSFTNIYHLQHLPTNIRQVNNLSVRLKKPLSE